MLLSVAVSLSVLLVACVGVAAVKIEMLLLSPLILVPSAEEGLPELFLLSFNADRRSFKEFLAWRRFQGDSLLVAPPAIEFDMTGSDNLCMCHEDGGVSLPVNGGADGNDSPVLVPDNELASKFCLWTRIPGLIPSSSKLLLVAVNFCLTELPPTEQLITS